MFRSAYEVAAQAIICGALGFRASIEVTEHPRTKKLCIRLLPWLKEVGIGTQIEPYHHVILETPHGKLSHEFQTEAYWRGESAAVFGWSIYLFDTPGRFDPIDPGLLATNLRILHASANQLLTSAKLRPQTEIDEYCLYCLEIRHQFQLKDLPRKARATLRSIHRKRLAELGMTEFLNRSKDIDTEASNLALTEPGVQALYVVRAMAAEWLLGKE
jgi:hypothetical protein